MTDHPTQPAVTEQRKRPRLLCTRQFRYLRIHTSELAEAYDITAVNFNCYGIAFFSTRPVADTETLRFSLCYDSDTLLIELDGLLGEVIYVKGSDVGFYVGVAFVSAQVEEPSAREALAMIEEDLRRYQTGDDRYGLDGCLAQDLAEP